ncbi:MAG: hypothetical protein D4R79_02250 [Comamonadaceae bacterium]|nr:MAG: hypothetical protein D4R79_02250 [Comamonadaceae bacterium]
MTTDQQFADTQAPTDFKAALVEEGRKLLEAREENRITRAAALADQAHALLMRQEIRNTSIGK